MDAAWNTVYLSGMALVVACIGTLASLSTLLRLCKPTVRVLEVGRRNHPMYARRMVLDIREWWRFSPERYEVVSDKPNGWVWLDDGTFVHEGTGPKVPQQQLETLWGLRFNASDETVAR